jgi:hypothetical protein
MFIPDIGTNVNFLGSVFLISTLKKSKKLLRKSGVIGLVLELQGFKVDLFALRLLLIFLGRIFICQAV